MIEIHRPSPNHSARPTGAKISAIVIHDTASHTASSALDWFSRPASGVSAHVVIAPDGTVYRVVDDARKAWHAGRSTLHGRPDCNGFSLGVEMVDTDADATTYTPKQIEACAEWCAEKCLRYGIPLNRIVGHEHVSPGRKVDPGSDWKWGPFLRRVASAMTRIDMLALMIFALIAATSPLSAECVTARDTWQLGTASPYNSCDLRSRDDASGRYWSRDCAADHNEGFLVDMRWPVSNPAKLSITSKVTAGADGFVALGARIGCGGLPAGLAYGAQSVNPTILAADTPASIVSTAVEGLNHAPNAACRIEFIREQAEGTDDLDADVSWLEVCW